MATGDQNDMLARLKSVLPPWFGRGDTPILDAVLSSFASVAASAYSLLQYTKAQTRLGTLTDGFLDLAALDFFGRRFRRRANEDDSLFRARLVAEVMRGRTTKAAMINALTALTGRTPTIFEPWNVTSTGGYNSGGIGYCTAGAYGSASLPATAIIYALRPLGEATATPNINGYNGVLGGYGVGAMEYTQPPSVTGIVSDDEILATIDLTKPAGVTVITTISN